MASRAIPPDGGSTCERAIAPPTDLGAFYNQVFLPLVRRATWRHGLSKEDARDVVQDAFVLAVQKIDLGGNPRAWLIQVVDHLCLNHARKTYRRAQLAKKWGTPHSKEQVRANSTEETLG